MRQAPHSQDIVVNRLTRKGSGEDSENSDLDQMARCEQLWFSFRNPYIWWERMPAVCLRPPCPLSRSSQIIPHRGCSSGSLLFLYFLFSVLTSIDHTHTLILMLTTPCSPQPCSPPPCSIKHLPLVLRPLHSLLPITDIPNTGIKSMLVNFRMAGCLLSTQQHCLHAYAWKAKACFSHEHIQLMTESPTQHRIHTGE